MRLCFDIETNGLLDELDRVHCISVRDVDTNEKFEYVHPEYEVEASGSIEDALEHLSDADELSGNNIVTFDFPALTKVYDWKYEGNVFDTLVCGRVLYPHIKLLDWKRNEARKKQGLEPLRFGNALPYSLKSWGIRLDELKGDYGDNRKDWSKFDKEMLDYCTQDVRLNTLLYHQLRKQQAARNVPDYLFETEQILTEIMEQQQQHGFLLDCASLDTLLEKLMLRQAELNDELSTLFPPRVVVYHTPKKKLRREKVIPFNPKSRQQAAWHLTNKYGWTPDKFTKSGQPKLDDKVLDTLSYPEAKKLSEIASINKILGYVSTGKSAWMKKMDDSNVLHPRVISVGTPHGRCGHSNPNIAQIPSVKKPFGKECREAFIPRPGNVMVGCDASGIQLRALAHYLARYDGGDYVQVVTTGDPHEKNREAAGLKTRDDAKTFIYAFLFGAGNEKLGLQLGASAQRAPRVGASVKKRFLKGFPALAKLLDKLKESGPYLRGIDGRPVPCDQNHVKLNYLLTSFEAAVMKLAHRLLKEKLDGMGWKFGVDYAQLAFVHDEYQFECPPENAETLGKAARQAIIDAGIQLGSRCPLDGEYKIGNNWMETH